MSSERPTGELKLSDMIPTRLNQIVREFRRLQKRMTDEQRREWWAKIQQGYCRECGGDDLPCYCCNDE